MHCRHCRSRMVPTEHQREGRSQQTSYLCPLCGATLASFRILGEREAARGVSPFAVRIPVTAGSSL
jgi:DNA-directed RNA polymerase subunit RPC12/RpoP